MTQEQKPIPPAKVKFDPKQRAKEKHGFEMPKIKERARLECEGCHEHKPFDQFSSGTDMVCIECRSKQDSKELAEIKEKEFQKLSGMLTNSEIMSGRKPLEHIGEYLAELMFNFGGPRVFTKQWFDHLKIAMSERPGSKMVLDQFRSIAKLIMETNKLQHQENIADMTDQQLRDQKKLAAVSVLSRMAEDPGSKGILLELLQSTGESAIDFATQPAVPSIEAAPNGPEQPQ